MITTNDTEEQLTEYREFLNESELNSDFSKSGNSSMVISEKISKIIKEMDKKSKKNKKNKKTLPFINYKLKTIKDSILNNLSSIILLNTKKDNSIKYDKSMLMIDLNNFGTKQNIVMLFSIRTYFFSNPDIESNNYFFTDYPSYNTPNNFFFDVNLEIENYSLNQFNEIFGDNKNSNIHSDKDYILTKKITTSNKNEPINKKCKGNEPFEIKNEKEYSYLKKKMKKKHDNSAPDNVRKKSKVLLLSIILDGINDEIKKINISPLKGKLKFFQEVKVNTTKEYNLLLLQKTLKSIFIDGINLKNEKLSGNLKIDNIKNQNIKIIEKIDEISKKENSEEEKIASEIKNFLEIKFENFFSDLDNNEFNNIIMKNIRIKIEGIDQLLDKKKGNKDNKAKIKDYIKNFPKKIKAMKNYKSPFDSALNS